MITQQKVYWNLDIYLKKYFIFNWLSTPWVPVQKVVPLPELLSHPSSKISDQFCCRGTAPCICKLFLQVPFHSHRTSFALDFSIMFLQTSMAQHFFLPTKWAFLIVWISYDEILELTITKRNNLQTLLLNTKYTTSLKNHILPHSAAKMQNIQLGEKNTFCPHSARSTLICSSYLETELDLQVCLYLKHWLPLSAGSQHYLCQPVDFSKMLA